MLRIFRILIIREKQVLRQLYYLVKSLGYNASIRIRKDKLNIYKISCCLNKTKLRKKSNVVKKIIQLDDIEDTNYVYDLETEEGCFQAGVGEIIVKNTDSIFIKFKTKGDTPVDKLKEAITCGQEAADLVNKHCNENLLQPQELEYEKTFLPLVLLTKKRYVGNKYEFDPEKIIEQTNMGVVLKRRDNSKIVKEIFQGVINVIMSTNDLYKAREFYMNSCKRLLKGEIRLDYLVTSKSLAATYKNPNSIPHRVLADRIAFRDPGNKPASNDRISYVYVNRDELKCFKCNKEVQSNKSKGYTGPKCLGCGQLFCRECIEESVHTCKRVCWDCKTPLKIKNRRDRVKMECKICGGIFCKKCHKETVCKTRLTNKILTGDCIETIEYVKERRLKPDYRHYLDSAVRNPVEQIFGLEMDDPSDILKKIIEEDNMKKLDKERVNIKCFFPKSYSIIVDK